MEQLLIATHNRGKMRELAQLLADLPYRLVTLDAQLIDPVAETGTTFAENACLKASGYARQTSLLTLADDSGLVVSALNGAPGVHSARFAGEGASDHERVEKLLAELANVPEAQRQATFISVIAIASEAGTILNTSTGECEGRIARAPRGQSGFGYDPIFVPEGFDQTFGELPAAVKNRLSHRARALAKATEFLRSLTVYQPGS